MVTPGETDRLGSRLRHLWRAAHLAASLAAPTAAAASVPPSAAAAGAGPGSGDDDGLAPAVAVAGVGRIGPDTALARHYMSELIATQQSSEFTMHSSLSTAICHQCRAILLPGTSITRTAPRRRRGKGRAAAAVIGGVINVQQRSTRLQTTCATCTAQQIRPVVRDPGEPAYRRPVQGAARRAAGKSKPASVRRDMSGSGHVAHGGARPSSATPSARPTPTRTPGSTPARSGSGSTSSLKRKKKQKKRNSRTDHSPAPLLLGDFLSSIE